MKIHASRLAALVVATAMLVSGGTAGLATISTTTVAQQDGASITFDDQTSNGSSVIIEAVVLPTGGFVVIEGPAGDRIGVSEYLEAGEHEDVTVTLDEPLTIDGELVAVAHRDTNMNQEFDFESDSLEDFAYGTVGDGSVVSETAEVTVAEMQETTTEVEGTLTTTPDTEETSTTAEEIEQPTTAQNETAPSEEVAIDEGLIGYWPFDELVGNTAVDSAGFDHNGMIVGAERVEGVEGSALAFGGNNTSYVDVNISAPDNFTISLWVRPSTLNTSPDNDYRHLVNSKNGNFVILEESGAVSFRVPGVNTSLFAAGNLTIGEWSHVAVTYNGTHRIIYVNGEQIGTQQIGFGTPIWGEGLRFASSFSSGTEHDFEGRLDEIRIYNQSLSSEEIQQIYGQDNNSSETTQS